MRSRRREQRLNEWRWLTGAALVAALFFTLILTGCATAPTIPHDLERAALCMQRGPCFVIKAENQLFDRAVIYLNGARVDDVEGLSGHPIWVPESLLKEGRCAYVEAVLPVSGAHFYSGRQCLVQDGFFTMRLAVGNHLWLDPWAPGQRVQ
jgi:hypothetical protein